MIYEGIEKNYTNIVDIKDEVHVSYINGPKVEIRGNSGDEYKVEFIDKKTNTIIYQSNIKTNHWSKSNAQYFIDWKIKVWKGDTLFHEEDFDATGKRVYIAISSKAIGDTLAWIPYAEEFRKKYNCDVVVSTFHNNLFEDEYDSIEFVKPGEVVKNLYAQFTVGLFYLEGENINHFKNPRDPKQIPMQEIATDILGLDYKEIKPKLTIPNFTKKRKYVTLGFHGTAQAKYWNNPNGWQEVVDYLRTNDYTVKLLSREGDGYMGNKHPKGILQLPEGPLERVIGELKQSTFFIGVGSGLSWLSWAVGTPTVMISGFSEPFTEMKDCIRISPTSDKCSGCFNRHRLDAGDWNWCPEHKGTDRQFECTKSITGSDVIRKLIEAKLV